MNLKKIQLNETVSFIEKQINQKPDVGIILGSGLGILASEIKKAIYIPYKDIPYFPVSTVAGHNGQFVFGELEGKYVMCMQGRFHYYEGYEFDQITLPIRVMKILGVKKLIVTNAAGGVNESFKAGDLMIIEDHINLMGVNPLRGENDDSFGSRFPDMTHAYNLEMREAAFSAAKELGINVKKGVYTALSGPSYETPAEIRYLRIVGTDAVGMSTVPEVIIANHSNIKILGISCITNMAAGIIGNKLDHKEVMDTANIIKDKFALLVKKTLLKI